jgi:hypothetical protein
VYVCVKVSHNGDIAVALVFEEWEVGWWKIDSDERHTFLPSDQEAAQNVGAVKVCRLNVPALRGLPGAERDASLSATIRTWSGFRAGHVIAETVLRIDIVRDFSLGEDRQVIVAKFNGPNSRG